MVYTVRVKSLTDGQAAALRNQYEDQCAYDEQGVRRVKQGSTTRGEELRFWRGMPHFPTRFVFVELWQNSEPGQHLVAGFNMVREESRDALWQLLELLEAVQISAVEFGPKGGQCPTKMIDVVRDEYPIKAARF